MSSKKSEIIKDLQSVESLVSDAKLCVDSLEDSIYRLKNGLDYISDAAAQLALDRITAIDTSDTKGSP